MWTAGIPFQYCQGTRRSQINLKLVTQTHLPWFMERTQFEETLKLDKQNYMRVDYLNKKKEEEQGKQTYRNVCGTYDSLPQRNRNG